MPKDAAALKRLVEGNPGGKPAFSLALAPLVRGEKDAWKPYLLAASRHDGLRVVLDVHVCAQKRWTGTDRLRRLIAKVSESPLRSQVAGWYVCDEPFGRSSPGRKNPVDIARIVDVVRIVREADPKAIVYADYAATAPLTEVDGKRQSFMWNGKWVTQADGPDGSRVSRRYGAFGEDVVMVNWWEDATSLSKWLPRITGDVAASRLMLVLGYDWTPRSDTADLRHLERLRRVVAVADKAGVAGYWLWPWQDVPAQGRVYKGVSGFWEDVPGTAGPRRRYAHLVESMR